MNIIDFIHEEVKRQGFTGASHVERSQYMLTAWKHAQDNRAKNYPITTVSISTWGFMIEPNVNGRTGWRNIDVIAGGRRCPRNEEVPALMDFFVTSIIPSNTAPPEKYHIFELIHPFVDGNGRVGKIIFNYLCNSMASPMWPPDFFGAGVP
jgi:hypothetical protein